MSVTSEDARDAQDARDDAAPVVFAATGPDAGFVRDWCALRGFIYATDEERGRNGADDGDGADSPDGDDVGSAGSAAAAAADSRPGRAAIRIRTVRSREARFLYIEETRTLSDEIYELDIDGSPPQANVTVTYSDLRGLRFALNAVARMLRSGDWRAGREYDYPRFPVRGIIEGFYGEPWTHEQRLAMLGYLASINMNTYFYAPKDDEYHRLQWREPYDAIAYSRLGDVFREAVSLGLDFYYGIAPGLSMRYASEDDYAALIGKTRQLFDLGVRRFGLLLDDIPDRLQHPGDVAAFADLPEAHARLANRFFADLKALDASVRLVVCPTQYWGRGDEYYIARLGEGIDPNIDLFWTGRNICSQELTLEEAAVFTRTAYRKPLYWDNYPVNDLEMRHELHIGPYRGRDRHLYRFSRGVIANGMEYAAASRIAFATIADYLWDPGRYEPEASWAEALAMAVPPGLLPQLRGFADNVRYSCLYPTDSPLLAEALSRFEYGWRFGDPAAALEQLDRFAAELLEAGDALLEAPPDRSPLLPELTRWLHKYADGIELLHACIAYLRCLLSVEAATAADASAAHGASNDNGGGSEAEAECLLTGIRDAFALYDRDPTRVFADVLGSFVHQVLERRFTHRFHNDFN